METVLVKKDLHLKSKMDGCFQSGRKKNLESLWKLRRSE